MAEKAGCGRGLYVEHYLQEHYQSICTYSGSFRKLCKDDDDNNLKLHVIPLFHEVIELAQFPVTTTRRLRTPERVSERELEVTPFS